MGENRTSQSPTALPTTQFARELKGKNYCKAVFGIGEIEAGNEEREEGIESANDSAK